jgi:hypothetical protein
MSLEWKKLRSWKNSVNSAFEELCCQLAESEPHPQGSVFLRKGTPDGGFKVQGRTDRSRIENYSVRAREHQFWAR